MKTAVSGAGGFAVAAVLGVLLAGAGVARADDEAKPAADPDKKLEAADLDQLDETAAGEGEGTFYAWADAVLGFGKETIAVQNPPGNNGGLPTYTSGGAQTTSESFLLGLQAAVSEHVHIGLRVPIIAAEFNPPASDGIQGRGLGGFGNVELEAEHFHALNDAVTYYGIIGISLPTATGSPLPENIKNLPGNLVDQGNYDRASALNAAALSRGQEVDALFETQRFGINPKLAFALKAADRFTITPSIKMENLIASAGDVPHKYLGELVPGLAFTYDATKSFQPLLKVWANWAFAGSDETKKFGVALEPQLLFNVDAFHTGLGVIVPVAGEATSPQFIGVRLYVGSSF